MDIQPRHEPDRSRFVAEIDGQEATVHYARPRAGLLDLRSTFVPPALRGRRIGDRLVLHVLAWARKRDLRVIPTCPFVELVIRRHPEQADLLAAEWEPPPG